MCIVYIGPGGGTSLHRARALERLGHEVHIVDPWSWLGHSKWVGQWVCRTGAVGVGLMIDRRVEIEVRGLQPDLIWVNQGEFLGAALIRRLRSMHVPIVNYANDNPFSNETWLKFRHYRSALAEYDIVVVVFLDAVERAKEFGAKHVIHTYLSADELAHSAKQAHDDQNLEYSAEVAFVGTWMREQRGHFVAELIRRGVPISVWGDRWNKAKEWDMIKPFWRGPGVYEADKYSAIIKSAKICLGLLNKSSNNKHTGRSIEIPALGSLFCAERTPEHQALYEEGKEAVFWGDAAECAELCHELLANEARRAEIARCGRDRALRNNFFHEPVMRKILDEAQRVFQEGR
jgi:spore maturation protein CgeB